jgi:hypothetical protein
MFNDLPNKLKNYWALKPQGGEIVESWFVAVKAGRRLPPASI